MSISIFARQPTSLLLRKTQERNNLVYCKCRNVRIDTSSMMNKISNKTEQKFIEDR